VKSDRTKLHGGLAPEALLWRYLDLPKLLLIFEKKAIYFQSPADFYDPFEGLYMEGSLEKIDISSDDQVDIDSVLEKLKSFSPLLQGNSKQVSTALFLNIVQTFLVSCWHNNPTESEAMWKLYSSINAGIAINTTVKQLEEILPAGMGDVYPIEYVDYSKSIRNLNIANSIFYKRDSLSHEKEARAFFLDMKQLDIKSDSIEPAKGKYVSCDPSKLINKIVLSPLLENWIADLIPKIVKRYGFSIPVVKSKMLDIPDGHVKGFNRTNKRT